MTTKKTQRSQKSQKIKKGMASQGERLQKVMAHAGIASRRAAEEMIEAGDVTINGRIAELGDRVTARDAIKVGGKLLRLSNSAPVVLALHKPEGTMTTTSDPEGRPTVFDLVPPGERRGLISIGRLDYGTEGLLLLTNDGELAQRVSHPKYGCTKVYLAKVRGQPEEAVLDRLRKGIRLDGVRLQPSKITPHRVGSKPKRSLSNNSWWRVELSEGRTRQVRRMFERVGHPVTRLRRVQIGPIRLGRLPKGGLRKLDDKEITALRHATKDRS